MGASGEAPPVRGQDVMILVGASIILVMFIIQTWSVPTTIKEGDDNEFVIKYDLSEGDTFSLEVLDGQVRPTVALPSGELEQYSDVDTNWEFTAQESGVHSFIILGNEDSSIEYSVTRGIIFDLLPYVIGTAILAFGIWKKVALAKEDPIEAVLED